MRCPAFDRFFSGWRRWLGIVVDDDQVSLESMLQQASDESRFHPAIAVGTLTAADFPLPKFRTFSTIGQPEVIIVQEALLEFRFYLA